MESGTANLLKMLEARVKELCQQEKWEEAVHAAETAVRKAREVGEADPGIVDELALSLEVKADLLRQLGRLDEAREDYLEALELLEGRTGYSEQIARVSASVAVIGDEQGDVESARHYYEKAIEIFSRMDPPSELDVADLSNNLAFLLEAQGDFDQAETLFLNALKTTHELLGKDDPETASICNNLGALYQKSGHFERAQEMHWIALETRLRKCGPHHPDTAQSHANLALSLAESRAFGPAREHFEKALAAFERNFRQHAADYETVAANYIDFLHRTGDIRGAKALERRAMKRLKRNRKS